MMKHRLSIAATCVWLLCGCAVYQHQGLYDVSASSGWRREASEASTLFYPPSARNADGYVVFTTVKKGELLILASFPGKIARFEKKELQVVPHDGGSPYLSSIEAARIFVPATSDFTIEVPAFTVNGKPMPPITARFTWSDRKYHVYRTLQDP